MTSALLSSKIVVKEEPPQMRQIVGVPTAVLAALGVCERGPVGVATRVTSFTQFRKIFGGYVTASKFASAVEGAFATEALQEAWIVRTAHYTDNTDPATCTAAAAALADSLATAAPIDTLDVAAKTPGAFGNAISIKIAAATSGEAERFNLTVLRSGVIAEFYPNLTMDPTDARYAVDFIADDGTGSDLIELTRVSSLSTTTLLARPVNGTFGPMTGGNDGLTSLADSDYVGATSVDGKTGLRCFDKVPDLALLMVPGVATAVVHSGMINYCEVIREGSIYAVLETPAGSTAEDAVTYTETTASLLELSEFGEIVWPWIKITNPSTAVYGNVPTITIPPSGDRIGAMVRTDAKRLGGIYDPPSGVERGLLLRAVGVDSEDCLESEKRDLVAPKRINPINRRGTGGRFYVDGTDTLKSTGDFPSVAERRGVIFIEQSIKRSLEFARHSNNDDDLRADCDTACDKFLDEQMKLKAFRSQVKEKAYFIDFGRGLNTDAVVFANKLLGRIGLATQKPVKWAILTFSQDTRAFDTAAALANG